MSTILTSLLTASSCVSHRITHSFFQPALKRMQPEAVLRVDGLGEDQKSVALTIDDSPSTETGAILDMLRDCNAVATFFVHGGNIRTKADERLIRRMLDEGHEVANHMPDLRIFRSKKNEPTLTNGESLVLRREPDNLHDELAILIPTEGGEKLGYVPRDPNEILARLMDAGKFLFSRLESKEWHGDWLHVSARVFLRDVWGDPI